MSKVASRKLCKELRNLTGWTDTDTLYCYTCEKVVPNYAKIEDDKTHESVPLYDLGYLIRALYEVKRNLRVEHNHSDMRWYAYFAGRDERNIEVGETINADTPEDACCLLLLKLIKEKVIKI